MFWRYSLLLGFIADLVGLWWDEVNKLSAAVHHQLSGIVRYSHIGKRFFNHFIDRRPRDRQIIVVARWRGHEGWAGQTFWRESKAGEEVQWVVNEKNTHSGGFVWRFKWCGRLSYSRSLKHCQRECILLNSNSGKESLCVCVCVSQGREDERSRYLSVDQFTLTLHIHTSELLLLLFLCAFIIMIQLRSFILKLSG